MAKKKDRIQSALHVLPGIEQPPQVSDDAVVRMKKTKRRGLSSEELFEGIQAGDRILLSKAITLVESVRPEDQIVAQQLIERCLPYSGRSIRIGITGVPGAGKSTFIEALGTYLTAKGHVLAVLAIDPSSSRSKGSILGDKTRMEALSADRNAFIRPSPSSGTLGGVARKTWETIVLCEAVGFDVIFVETVGVGQSETAVYSMVDFFLLLMLSGAGDELQGIKRGIMEMADAIVLNKTDGDNKKKALLAASEYRNALMLFPPQDSGWNPPVLNCSSIEKTGISELWELVEDFRSSMEASGHFQRKRSEQSKIRMHQSIHEQLGADFYRNPSIKTMLLEYEQAINDNKISAYIAAKRLIEAYYSMRGSKS
jgi:LAO/AO transport system kinase